MDKRIFIDFMPDKITIMHSHMERAPFGHHDHSVDPDEKWPADSSSSGRQHSRQGPPSTPMARPR